MEEDVHEYDGADISVTYDSNRCIHVRACVEGLPEVFDTDQRPWVQPDEADAEDVAAVVEHCPTGALHYDRSDGGSGEETPSTNTVVATEHGPLYIRGDVTVRTPEESLLEDTRIGLCRCGHSMNKPLCDNSHSRVFDAEGVPGEATEAPNIDDELGDDTPDGNLTITATANGPFLFDGPFTLSHHDGTTSRHEETSLCRCGSSDDKPFCDGTHAEIGFTTEKGE